MLTPLSSSRSKMANKIHSARESSTQQDRLQSVGAVQSRPQGLDAGSGAMDPYDASRHARATAPTGGARFHREMTPQREVGDASRCLTVVPLDGLRQLLQELLREQTASIVREIRVDSEMQGSTRDLLRHFGQDCRQRVEKGFAEDGSAQHSHHSATGHAHDAAAGRACHGDDGPGRTQSAPRSPPAPEVFRPSMTQEADVPEQRKSWRDKVADTLDEHHMESTSATMQRAESCFEQWQNMEDVERHRSVDLIVRSRTFQTVTLGVIMLNMLFLAAAVNYEISNGRDLMMDNQLAFIVKYLFLVFYFVEMVLRMISEGKFFWLGKNMGWNIWDFCIVFGSIIGEFFQVSNASFLRSLRFFSIAKVGRMMPVLRWVGFGDLALMTSQVMGSIATLVWCMALLAFITFIFAVYFMQAFIDADYTAQNSTLITSKWNSVSQSMLTLLMTTTGGVDWADTYYELDMLSGLNRTMFLAYVLFSLIAIWNIITSTFVNKALNLGKTDNEAMAVEDRLRSMKDEKMLRKLLMKADTDQSKLIDSHEFDSFVANPESKAFMESKGIDMKEAAMFFQMLCEAGENSQGKSVDIPAIVSCILRVKGQATSIDLYTMRYEMRSMMKAQSRALHRLQTLVEADYQAVGSPFASESPSQHERKDANGELTL